MNSRVLVCSKLLYQQRRIQTSAVCFVDKKWRREHGLPSNPTSFGPLTNKPDYSYEDGRPVPIGANARERLVKQREYAKKIVQYLHEVDNAVERHRKIKEEEEQQRNKILQSKLTPKGKRELE